MLLGVHHTSFTVSNLERSLHFYRDILGMEVVARLDGPRPHWRAITGFADADLDVAIVRVPGDRHFLELIEYRTPKGGVLDAKNTANVGSAHLCFKVEDLSACFADLQSKGVRFKSNAPVPITSGGNAGGYSVYLLDPDDITLELIQPPAE